MIFVTQRCDMRVNVYGLGTISWTQLKSRLPESQKTRCSFRYCIVAPGELCCHGFRLGSFSLLRVKQSLFWQSCMRAAVQFVGVIEHDKSLNTDVHCVAAS